MVRPGSWSSRRGLALAELLVVVAIVGVLVLLVLLTLPGRREEARRIACQRNLGQIGLALGLYAQAHDGRLPTVPEQPGARPGPLAALLEFVGSADFSGLSPDAEPPTGSPRVPVTERRIPGFLCPSDPQALLGSFVAPVSYRATTGDQPEGRTGPFAPGRSVTMEEVEAADGLSFTSAFAERLLGDGRDTVGPNNYAKVPGPISAAECPECPAESWRGDAGSSWIASDWVSTLYNHALPPGAARSCVATDGRSALMGASSGHANRVHVLRLDGSVQTSQQGIDLKIWKALATIQDRSPNSEQ